MFQVIRQLEKLSHHPELFKDMPLPANSNTHKENMLPASTAHSNMISTDSKSSDLSLPISHTAVVFTDGDNSPEWDSLKIPFASLAGQSPQTYTDKDIDIVQSELHSANDESLPIQYSKDDQSDQIERSKQTTVDKNCVPQTSAFSFLYENK